MLVSDEELSTGPLDARVDRYELARRLAQLFPNARILLVVRNQIPLLASCYCQLAAIAKVDGWNYRAWLDEQLARPHRFLHLFRINEALRLWAEHFGAERVHVRTHEQLRADGAAFVESVAPLLGVEVDMLRSISIGLRRNTSIRRRWLLVEQATARAPWLPDPRESKHPRIRAAALEFVGGGPGLDTAVSPEQHRRLVDYYGPDNARAAQDQDLPLARLGYPLVRAPAPSGVTAEDSTTTLKETST